MVTVVWDLQGIILIHYLEKGKTITGIYYSLLWDRFETKLQEKCLPWWQRISSCLSTTIGIRLPSFHIPPFSRFDSVGLLSVPDMKKWLARKRLYSNEEMFAKINGDWTNLIIQDYVFPKKLSSFHFCTYQEGKRKYFNWFLPCKDLLIF